jgi:hypothetical protein
MEKQDWRDRLRACFEGIDILEKCKFETAENFKQFCEFIAEPAFETLAEELKKYGIKARYGFLRGRSISLRFYFPRSNGENFQYSIYLPKNSVELKLRLYIRGRKTMKDPWDEKDESFIEKVPADKVIKMAKEDLIEDIIEHYKNFTYAALTVPD